MMFWTFGCPSRCCYDNCALVLIIHKGTNIYISGLNVILRRVEIMTKTFI